MPMYILKRILSLIPVLFVVSIVIFLIIHITPRDSATVFLGEEAIQVQVDDLPSQLGLDLPLYEQYLHWIAGVFRWYLGTSFFMREPVLYSIMKHLQPTLSLAILAQAISLFIAIPLGIAAANRRGTLADQSIMGVSL